MEQTSISISTAEDFQAFSRYIHSLENFHFYIYSIISSHLFATKWMRNKDGLTSHNPAVCTNECHHIYRQTVTDHMPYIDPKIFRLPLCWGLGLYT